MQRWHPLGLAARQLSLPITLTCGQSFRWTQLQGGRWGGVVAGSLVLLRTMHDAVEFSPVNCGPSVGEGAAEKHTRELLLDYFNAEAPLERMYHEWSRFAPAFHRSPQRSAAPPNLTLPFPFGSADARFKQLSAVFSGLRVLRQDPHECLFSFLCSSNNNIMVRCRCTVHTTLQHSARRHARRSASRSCSTRCARRAAHRWAPSTAASSTASPRWRDCVS